MGKIIDHHVAEATMVTHNSEMICNNHDSASIDMDVSAYHAGIPLSLPMCNDKLFYFGKEL